MSDVYETVTIENLSEASSLDANDLLLISQNSTEKKLPASKLGGAIIDDTSTANNKVLSAQKVTNELDGKQGVLNASQLAAVNSGITASDKTKLDGNVYTLEMQGSNSFTGVCESKNGVLYINGFFIFPNEIDINTVIAWMPAACKNNQFLTIIRDYDSIPRTLKISNTNGMEVNGLKVPAGYYIVNTSIVLS